MRNYSYDFHLQVHSHEDSFWNRCTDKHSSASCSLGPLIYFWLLYFISCSIGFLFWVFVLFCLSHLLQADFSLNYSVGGAVFLWSAVRSKTDWAVWVRALAGNIVLCSSGTHSTLTVPLSTQVYKWVPANLMLGVRPCDGLASHPGGSRYILLCSYADFLLTWIDILVICHYRSGWR